MQCVSISQLSTSRWSFHQDILKYSALGCHSVGIWRNKVDEIGPQEAADFLFEMRMGVSSVHWCGGFTGSTGISYVDALNDAIESVKLAGIVGAETLIVHPGARNGHTHRHSNRLLESALNAIIPVAADYGVRIALEPMQFAKHCPWTFLNGFQQTYSVLSNYDPADIGFVLDLFHMGSNFQMLPQLPDLLNRLALVQVSDRKRAGDFSGKRCPLGAGALPLRDWLLKLAEIGYHGHYEIETWGVASTPDDYAKIISDDFEFLNRELETAAVKADSKQSTRG